VKESTEKFFRIMNEANARIATQEAEEASKQPAGVGVDQVRLQKDAERREKMGQLRARPKTKKKTHHVHNVFGHVNVDP
jgi:hypothetical protein